nr:HAD hydrolase family protein [Pasteurella multocida]
MIFVFDLDGTICFDGKQIPLDIQHALEQLMQKDHQLIFASARPIRDLLPLLNPKLQQAMLIGGMVRLPKSINKLPPNNQFLVLLLHKSSNGLRNLI